jgi:hypothetical protein
MLLFNFFFSKFTHIIILFVDIGYELYEHTSSGLSFNFDNIIPYFHIFPNNLVFSETYNVFISKINNRHLIKFRKGKIEYSKKILD